MKKQLAIIGVLLMSIFIGFGIIIPVLPVKVDETHLGLLLSVYSAASFFMSPFWGRLSDRIGRRPLIMIGTLGFSVSFLLFGLAGDNLVLMYISRILGGLFSGAATACAVAYVADITTEENRTKGMGVVGMSIGLGFIFGPAVGGILSVFSYELPFFVSAGLALVTFFFAFSFLKESLPPEKRSQPSEDKPSRWIAFTGSLKYLYVLSFFVTFSLAGLETTLQLFQTAKIGATPLQIGLMFAFSGVIGAAVQGGYIRRKVKKGDEEKTVRAGLILSAVGFILLLFSSNIYNAAIFLCVFSVGNALIRPCVTSLITQKTTVGQGVATGLNSSMDSLGRIVGPLLGALFFKLDMMLPFISGAIFSLGALALLYQYRVLDTKATSMKKASA